MEARHVVRNGADGSAAAERAKRRAERVLADWIDTMPDAEAYVLDNMPASYKRALLEKIEEAILEGRRELDEPRKG